jgi:hypothetical protein
MNSDIGDSATNCDGKQNSLWTTPDVTSSSSAGAGIVIVMGDSAERMRELPNGNDKLIVTSPRYDLGKSYKRATDLGQP